MAKFRNNTRSVLRFTLGDKQEFAIDAGEECELPEQNSYIRSVEAQGLISRCEEPTSANSPSGGTPSRGSRRKSRQNLNEK